MSKTKENLMYAGLIVAWFTFLLTVLSIVGTV
jgi:hypothetical protein